MYIYASNTGESVSQFQTPHRSGYISLSPSGKRVVIGGASSVATVWDIASGAELFHYKVNGYAIPEYSPDGTKLLIVNFEEDRGRVQIFLTWQSHGELIEYAKECCVV